jgi:hypothetical protein
MWQRSKLFLCSRFYADLFSNVFHGNQTQAGILFKGDFDRHSKPSHQKRKFGINFNSLSFKCYHHNIIWKIISIFIASNFVNAKFKLCNFEFCTLSLKFAFKFFLRVNFIQFNWNYNVTLKDTTRASTKSRSDKAFTGAYKDTDF